MCKITGVFEPLDIEQSSASIEDVYDLIHPDWPFFKSEAEREELKALLTNTIYSLSLNHFEKMRIFKTELSRLQVIELLNVFEEERDEFKKLMDTEIEAIKELRIKRMRDWREHLLPELLLGPQLDEEQDKLALLDALIADQMEGASEFP